jgi:hypothetical protein
MVTRLDRFVLFPQFDGPPRIAFQVHGGQITFQAGEREHLVHHLKYQHILPEWKAFGDAGLGQAVSRISSMFIDWNYPCILRQLKFQIKPCILDHP